MDIPKVEFRTVSYMPAIGLGTDGHIKAAPGEVGRAVRAAIDLGYRHIDCALLYQNEGEIGEAIRDKISEGVVKREDLFITSKLWNTYHRKDLVIKGCKKSLRNFGLDYLDMYLIHWPLAFKPTDKADEATPEVGSIRDVVMSQEEFMPKDSAGDIIFADEDDYVTTWLEMEKCVELGLTKSIGVSNFNNTQIKRIIGAGNIRPACNQIEVHPYLTQKGIREFCRSQKIVVVAYCPLGSANEDLGYVKVLDNPIVLKLAQEIGRSPAQVVLRYLIQLGTVPIPKSTNPERLKANLNVFDFDLSDSQMAELASLDSDKRICNFPGVERSIHAPF